MASIRRMYFLEIDTIRPVTKDRTFNAGNGRRRKAGTPDKMQLSQSSITHEIVNAKGAKPMLPDGDPEVHAGLVVNFGSTQGLNRPPHTTAVYDGKDWYYILTATDVFGAPVKECGLTVQEKGQRIYFGRAIPPEELPTIYEAIREALNMPNIFRTCNY